MPVKSFYYNSKQIVKWEWPLKVGLLSGARQLKHSLPNKWANKFTTIDLSTDGRNKKHINILISTKLSDLTFGASSNITSDVLIVLENDGFENKQKSVLTALSKSYKCSGIFVISEKKAFVLKWFNDLLVYLSHNRNIVQALRNTVVDGYFFYDKKLDRGIIFSHVIKSFPKSARIEGFPADTDISDLPNILPAPHKRKSLSPPKSTERSRRFNSPRFLQAQIKTVKDETLKEFLIPGNHYKLEVRVGYEDEAFVDSNQPIASEDIFKDNKKNKEKLQINFKSNQSKKIQSAEIILPRIGNSTLADFTFSITAISKKFEGEIYAYHKNRLIQQVQITAGVFRKGSAATPEKLLQMKLIFCTRRNLDSLDERTEFAASLEYESGKKKSSALQGVAGNKTVDLTFPDGLKEHLKDIKTFIEDALIDTKKHPAKLTALGNQKLLLALALKGNLIYTNHLRDAIIPDGPLQIVTNNQQYEPLEFVYSYPCPDMNAKLCKNAIAALKEGKCKKCFDLTMEPASHICPFGFWSFSRIVERHSFQKRKNNSNADYSIVSEPTGKRNTLKILQNAIYGSSQKVDFPPPQDIRKQIAAEIKRNTKTLFEAANWNDWTAHVKKHNPDSIILVVHIEKELRFKIDQIEIGNNNFLIQNNFGSSMINKNKLKPPPFVIIIGCEATDLKAGGFDVSDQLMNEGAAIVVSNFTKIRGIQAKDVVIKLVDFLKKIGTKDTQFGEVMLRLRQYLLSEGLMAGLSLIAQGDADWKINS